MFMHAFQEVFDTLLNCVQRDATAAPQGNFPFVRRTTPRSVGTSRTAVYSAKYPSIVPSFRALSSGISDKTRPFFRKEKTPSDLDGVFKLQIEIGLDGADNAVVVVGRGDAVGQLFQLRMSVFHAIGQAGGLEQLGIV